MIYWNELLVSDIPDDDLLVFLLMQTDDQVVHINPDRAPVLTKNLEFALAVIKNANDAGMLLPEKAQALLIIGNALLQELAKAPKPKSGAT